MKRVIEKYNSYIDSHYALHNDVLQNQALNEIENNINNISNTINEINTNKQKTVSNINEIDKDIQQLNSDFNRLETILQEY